MNKNKFSKKIQAAVLGMVFAASGIAFATDYKTIDINEYLLNLDESVKDNIVKLILRNASDEDLVFLKEVEGKTSLTPEEQEKLKEIIKKGNDIKAQGQPLFGDDGGK